MNSMNGRGHEVDAGGANRQNKPANGNGNKPSQSQKEANPLNQNQNPFSKPIFEQSKVQNGQEEAKQPAGVLPVSKASGQKSALDDTQAALRLLVLADTTASFYCIEKSSSKDTKAPAV